MLAHKVILATSFSLNFDRKDKKYHVTTVADDQNKFLKDRHLNKKGGGSTSNFDLRRIIVVSFYD